MPPRGLNVAPVVDAAAEPGRGAGEGYVSLSRFAKRARETMSTSDFTMFADVTDRGVIAGYTDATIPTTFEQLGYRRDTVDLARADGTGRGRDYRINATKLVPRVAEGADYDVHDVSDEYFSFTTYKYGWIDDITWEAYLADNRDLGIITSEPMTWGRSARYTQEYLWTAAWAANATYLNSDNGNKGTAALTIEALEAAIAALVTQSDPSSNVAAYAGPIFLVVPPQLAATARSIVNSTEIVLGGTAGAVTIRPSQNPVNNLATVVVNHFLPSLDTNTGDTGWYLFTAPRIRPAVRYGFLRGFEEPEVFIRDSDARALMGGTQDPFAGTFERDAIRRKLRFTFGVNWVNYRGVYWSDGSA